MQVIKDRNAGNGIHTYWKARAEREYCIQINENEFARDSKGRVRRFSTRQKAAEVMQTLS